MIDRACISLNNNCNLHCRYCHFQEKQKDYSSFIFPQLKVILDNIHAYCIQHSIKKFKLGIVGSGEPMLKADTIIDILDYVSIKSYSELSMYTISNGTLFTDNLMEKFLKYKDFEFPHFLKSNHSKAHIPKYWDNVTCCDCSFLKRNPFIPERVPARTHSIAYPNA